MIGEAIDFARSIDVAQVDQDRLFHDRFKAIEVEGPELLPFGDDDQGIRVRAIIGAVANSTAVITSFACSIPTGS